MTSLRLDDREGSVMVARETAEVQIAGMGLTPKERLPEPGGFD